MPDAAGHVEGLPVGPVRLRHLQGERRRLEPDQAAPSAPGYDAEATVCPIDGSIIFTSMRSGDLELWRMDADGKNLRQLTRHARLRRRRVLLARTARRSCGVRRGRSGKELDDVQGAARAEPGQADEDGPLDRQRRRHGARQLTYLPGASFAPFFFPERQARDVRVELPEPARARVRPVRDRHRRHAPRADHVRARLRRLPGVLARRQDARVLVEPPRRDRGAQGDVYRITGTPAGAHDTNVFLADWVDGPTAPARSAAGDRRAPIGSRSRRRTSPTTRARAAASARNGLERRRRHGAERSSKPRASSPACRTRWRQTFDVTTEVKRGDRPRSRSTASRVAADDFAPMAVLREHDRDGRDRAVGYGIVDADAKLDDYKGKNVKGKIVLVHRFTPPDTQLDADGAGAPRRPPLQGVRRARQRGAIGLLVVDDGDPKPGRGAAAEARHRRHGRSARRRIADRAS